MAVLEIVSTIRHTLTNAISYIQNAKKTTLEDGTRLIANNFGGGYKAAEEAHEMLDQVRKNPHGLLPSSRVALHLVQSWPDEDAQKITPQQALMLGRKMAEEITGGNSHYIVAVHISQARLHAHIIIANHNDQTGRANQTTPKDFQQWRQYNDRLAKQYGLSTLPEPQIGHEISRTETTRQKIGSLYAQATGQSWVEDLKNHIDEAGAMSDTWQQFREYLHQYGVNVTPRGKHLTYMLSWNGTKIRDTRLGAAYTPANIFGRIDKRPVTEISFSRRLVIKHTDDTVRIMIPGTHGTKRLTIRADQIIKTGPNTWHAYIPQDRPLTLTDRRGRLAGRIRAVALTTAFVQPGASIEREYKTLRPRITTAQAAQANRAYVWQARQIARAQQAEDALRIIEANDHGGHDARNAIASLLIQIDNARSSLAAQVAAMANAEHESQIDPSQAETPAERDLRTQQIESIQQQIDALSWQIRTVRTVQQEQEEQQQENDWGEPDEDLDGPSL